jgi:hypothetical protein
MESQRGSPKKRAACLRCMTTITIGASESQCGFPLSSRCSRRWLQLSPRGFGFRRTSVTKGGSPSISTKPQTGKPLLRLFKRGTDWCRNPHVDSRSDVGRAVC